MAVTDKSKTPDFVVRLVGSDIKPWKVPLRALSRLMEAIQQLVEQSESVEEGEDKSEVTESQEADLLPLGSPVLKLVGIKSNSAAYAISTPSRDAALGLLNATGEAIQNPETSDWSSPTISSLKRVSDIARSLGVRVEIREPNKRGRLGDVIAKITPDTYEKIANSAFVTGDTSLYGRIERVGGASASRCMFRLPEETKVIFCDVASADLAKKLAQHLYQNVSVHGEAKWLRSNWRLLGFEIRSFEPPKTGSFRAAFADIWKAGGSAWDKVEDPDGFISEMRGQ